MNDPDSHTQKRETRAFLACVATGAALSAAVMYLPPATAHADPGNDTDSVFVMLMHQYGITNTYGDAAMIAAAHEICSDFINGTSWAGELGDILSHHGLDAQHAGYLIGGAVASYCPQFEHIEDQPIVPNTAPTVAPRVHLDRAI